MNAWFATANSCTSREVSEANLSRTHPILLPRIRVYGRWSMSVGCWSPLSLSYTCRSRLLVAEVKSRNEILNCYIIMGSANLNSRPSMWLPSSPTLLRSRRPVLGRSVGNWLSAVCIGPPSETCGWDSAKSIISIGTLFITDLTHIQH